MKKRLLFIFVLSICFMSFKISGHAASSTYKVVYHFSLNNKAKQVTKTYKVGSTRPKMLSAKSLGFKSSTDVWLGWNGYSKKKAKWIRFNTNPNKNTDFGSYQTKLQLLHDGKQIPYSPIEGEELHLYGFWMKASKINVSHYVFTQKNYSGTAEYNQLRNALNVAQNTTLPITVYAPKKTYAIKTLNIYSDTKLIFEEGSIITRDTSFGGNMLWGKGKKGQLGGYNQGNNITISGGTWKNNPNGSIFNEFDVMRFEHGKNIVLKNMTIGYYSGKHVIAFAGVKDILLSKVTFRDYIDNPTSKFNTNPDYLWRIQEVRSHGEALHIDTCDQDGEPSAKPVDGTICENVSIVNCKFINVLVGLGCHTNSTKWTNNFQVRNCTFQNNYYVAMNLFGKERVVLSNNIVKQPYPYFYLCLNDVSKYYILNDHPERGVAEGKKWARNFDFSKK